jgi:hypothetical protein
VWIRGLLQEGFEPVLRVVDEGFGDSWSDTERFWIKFYREEVGADLTNMTKGGFGIFGCSEDVSKRIGASSKIRMTSEQAKKVRQSRPNKPHSEETKAKISTSSMGKHSIPSPAVSEANRNRVYTDEMRRRIGEATRRSWEQGNFDKRKRGKS